MTVYNRIRIRMRFLALAAFVGAAPSYAQSAARMGATYQIPNGWSRSESGGTVTLSQVVNLGFGVKQDFRLVIMPLERTSGNLLPAFLELWHRYVGAIFISPGPPLPLRVRVAGGALLFDGDNMRIRQNNAAINGFLYAVSNGETILPVMGFFNGWDASLDRDLKQFFASVRLPGAPPRQQPLFASDEIAGVWRSSSSSLANWVDVYGNYRGDASVATGETLTLRPGGEYESQFAAIGGGSGRFRQHDVGRFAVDDDTLVLRPNDPGGRETRYRITGVGRSTDGRGSFLLLAVTRNDYPALSAGSRRPGAGDLYVSVR